VKVSVRAPLPALTLLQIGSKIILSISGGIYMSLINGNAKLLKITIAPLSAFMALIMAFTSNIFYRPGIMTMPKVPDSFTPVVRFTVTSDVHLKDEGGEAEAYRLGLMIRSSYDIAESDSSYNKLDAVAFAGDFSNDGSPSTLKLFRDICESNLKGDTKNLAVLGNHEFSYDKANTIANFESIVGLPYRYHKVINGVHFIGMSPDNGGSGYTFDTQVWLNKQLKEAVADNPKNPIFVFQHHHIWGTVYGSESWGNIDLSTVLSQYPQVVDFSGHSHYPINDPRSIWQGAFTALGTGTLSYFEMESSLFGKGQFPEGNHNAAQMYVVEVDANGSTRIRSYDLLANQFIGETYYIAKPAGRTTFAYNTVNRIAKDKKPVFDAGAKITASKTADCSYSINFPAAKDSLVVWQYKITVRQNLGAAAFKTTHLSDYYYTPMPTEYNINIGNLHSGKTYNATVLAMNAYYKLSKPLTLTFTAE